MNVYKCSECASWISKEAMESGRKRWSLIEPVVFECQNCKVNLRPSVLALLMLWGFMFCAIIYLFTDIDVGLLGMALFLGVIIIGRMGKGVSLAS